MARGTSADSSGLWGIVVLGMDPDGPGIGKLLIFAVAGETERIIIVCLDQLGPAGPSVGVVAIKTEDACIEMATLLKVEPLLMLGFGMGLRISPGPWLELVIIGQGLSYFIGLVILVVPRKLKSPIRNAYPSRMALATHFQTSFVR